MAGNENDYLTQPRWYGVNTAREIDKVNFGLSWRNQNGGITYFTHGSNN